MDYSQIVQDFFRIPGGSVLGRRQHPTTSFTNTDDTCKLVLRAALAITLLFHGVSKLFGGIGFVADMLAQAGAPAFQGYGVHIGEVVAPLMILVGFYARPRRADRCRQHDRGSDAGPHQPVLHAQ